LVLKGVTEILFLVLKRISGNSEDDQYFILPNFSSITKLQFCNIKYEFSSEFTLIFFLLKPKMGDCFYEPDGNKSVFYAMSKSVILFKQKLPLKSVSKL
jgi:hypothetical protein